MGCAENYFSFIFDRISNHQKLVFWARFSQNENHHKIFIFHFIERRAIITTFIPSHRQKDDGSFPYLTFSLILEKFHMYETKRYKKGKQKEIEEYLQRLTFLDLHWQDLWQCTNVVGQAFYLAFLDNIPNDFLYPMLKSEAPTSSKKRELKEKFENYFSDKFMGDKRAKVWYETLVWKMLSTHS